MGRTRRSRFELIRRSGRRGGVGERRLFLWIAHRRERGKRRGGKGRETRGEEVAEGRALEDLLEATGVERARVGSGQEVVGGEKERREGQLKIQRKGKGESRSVGRQV